MPTDKVEIYQLDGLVADGMPKSGVDTFAELLEVFGTLCILHSDIEKFRSLIPLPGKEAERDLLFSQPAISLDTDS